MLVDHWLIDWLLNWLLDWLLLAWSCTYGKRSLLDDLPWNGGFCSADSLCGLSLATMPD